MFGFKMKLGLGNKVLLPEYGQKKVLDLEQFVSSNLNTDDGTTYLGNSEFVIYAAQQILEMSSIIY
jgi:hypothetical protein